MILKSYSFKTREEADNLEKTVKKLFKEETITMNGFRNTICEICPYKCRICPFCWNMFYKLKNAKVDYRAPLAILKVLIGAHYDSLYIPTFYFLKKNICNVCERYGQGCLSVSIGDACPSRYLIQMDSNEDAKIGAPSINREPWYDNHESEYEYLDKHIYPNNYRPFVSISDTKPKLSVNGEKIKILVNKLFGPMENEHA